MINQKVTNDNLNLFYKWTISLKAAVELSMNSSSDTISESYQFSSWKWIFSNYEVSVPSEYMAG